MRGYVDVSLWEERHMQYGPGMVKLYDTVWRSEDLREVAGYDAICRLRGVGSVSVCRTHEGDKIIQVSGYDGRGPGLYCYLVDPDHNMILKEARHDDL